MNDTLKFTYTLDKKNEALISGIGILSPIGNSVCEVLESVKNLRDGIANAEKIDTSKFASNLAGEVKNFKFENVLTKKELEDFSDPFIRLAISAAKAALADANINPQNVKIAAVLGTCNAGMNSLERQYKKMYVDSRIRFDRRDCMQSEFYALAKAISSSLKISGQSWLISTACSSATAAIGLAQSLINSGEYDFVLVGASDAMALANYAGFNAIKVVSANKTAPFSTPTGLNIGEGAAFWILESSKSVKARNVKVYAKVIGSATTADAHHPTQPDPRGDGVFRTLRNAILDAGVEISQIAAVNAHGSGTPANDKAEAKGIVKLFGENVSVTSLKSYTGHCMGATGIIESTCQILAMNCGFIPPTLHFTQARLGCENLNVVKNSPLKKDYDCFIKANYAFAGNNAAILIVKTNFTNFVAPKKSEKQTAVITGCGTINPLALGFENTAKALANDTVAIAECAEFGKDVLAGIVKIPSPREFDRRLDFSGMNRISQCATMAASLALKDAMIDINRTNAEDFGLVLSVCKGSSESKHMKGVFDDPERRGDIACFSNVTANSTAGWVSKALQIKGANVTFASGYDSGIQALAYAADLVKNSRAKCVIAQSSDELFKEQIDACKVSGFLHDFKAPEMFKIDPNNDFKTVLGEGSAAFAVEEKSSALARNANILGEILAFDCSMDTDDFYAQNLCVDGLKSTINSALKKADLKSCDIDLIVWSPRGIKRDVCVQKLCLEMFPQAPMSTSVFNTGYIESSSLLISLGAVLKALQLNIALSKQKTGIAEIDNANVAQNPKRILCIASSFSGNNYAMVVARP